MKLQVLILIVCSISSSIPQTDTIKYQWPIPNFNSSKNLNATFGEFRDTGSLDHFHNAVDIGEPDGNPVYPSIDGVVYYFSDNGYDSYINVKTEINGFKKHLTYYHVVPSPSLYIGQEVIAGQTILGTIYVGAAHVHLIERELLSRSSSNIGNEINPVRPEGGLFPYFDIYAPSIIESSLKFYKDNTSILLPADQLTGKIDIRIEVREQNGPSYSHSNNGTYILGYRILSEDGNAIIYEPSNNGMKYRFYFLPEAGYVHQAFVKGIATLSDPVYWLTNGNGEQHMNSTLSIPNNFLDTDLLDEGAYLLEIFSEDTRGNSTARTFPISITKLPPELRTVHTKNDSIYISWTPYSLNNLKGYRLYYSTLKSLSNWELAADENLLHGLSNGAIFSGPEEFFIPSEGEEFYFYISAIDDNGNESGPSDIYSLSLKTNDLPKTLIVDGFDRYGGTGSWEKPQHYFNSYYFNAILENEEYNISSCSNEAVIDEEIYLDDFDFVVWFVGDETIAENTFVNQEQRSIAFYLENGGKIIVSGEDIGRDLDTKHSNNEFTDTLFYHQYLKAKLIHDGLDLLFEVNGEDGTVFSDFNAHFGNTYPVEVPDDIEPINGAYPILNYTYERDNAYRKGGIAYHGTFGTSEEIGAMVYLSFPFETIAEEDVRKELFKRIINNFNNGPVSVDEPEIVSNNSFVLCQNYPNPFNPITKISYTLPNFNQSVSLGTTRESLIHNVRITVYDVLGQKVKTIINQQQKPGNYVIEFEGSSFPSGIYYYQLKSGNYSKTKKMILLK